MTKELAHMLPKELRKKFHLAVNGYEPDRIVDEMNKNTLLHLLVRATDVEDELKLLIEAGADLNIKNLFGHTPLGCATSPSAIKVLLDAGADPYLANNKGEAPLHYAIYTKKNDLMEAFLNSNPSRMTGLRIKTLHQDDTPLHIAAWTNNIKAAKLLIEAGANPNVLNLEYLTPLHCAAKANDPEMMDLLVKYGADINKFKLPETPYPLHMCLRANLADMAFRLIEHGADIDLQDNEGQTPLMIAIKTCSSDVIMKLLEYKPDVNKKDNDKQTVIHKIYPNVDRKALAIILKATKNINAKDNNGDTPLHNLFSEKQSNSTQDRKTQGLVTIFVGRGANVNLKNKDGESACDLARKNNFDFSVYKLACAERNQSKNASKPGPKK